VDLAVVNVRRVVAGLTTKLALQDVVCRDCAAWSVSAAIVNALTAGNDSMAIRLLEEQFYLANWAASPTRQNMLAIYGLQGEHLFSIYHPTLPDGTISGSAESVSPLFLGQTNASVKFLAGVFPHFSGIVTPPGRPTLLISVNPVRIGGLVTDTQVGHMVWGAEILVH
jgi:hypothetical protein